jgi:hypothetical protein
VTPERLIDVPIESLPFVDEHSVTISATADETFQALLEVLDRGVSNTHVGRALAHRLECLPAERRGDLRQIGSTVPGFIVTRSVPPAVLALMGEHRFSRYALIFRITERIGAPLLLSAETRAEFPGRSGRAYRTAVIGSRGHVLATRSILRSVRRSAQRHPTFAAGANPGGSP